MKFPKSLAMSLTLGPLAASTSSPSLAALPAGATAPDFRLNAALGGKPFNFSLRDAQRRGPVVVYFFPAAFTQGCTIEAHMFAEASKHQVASDLCARTVARLAKCGPGRVRAPSQARPQGDRD